MSIPSIGPSCRDWQPLQFIHPTPPTDQFHNAQDYHVGDVLPITFCGGGNRSTNLPPTESFGLTLESSYKNANRTISIQEYVFGSDAWYLPVNCNNTIVSYNWTIPSDLNLTNAFFELIASNESSKDSPSSLSAPFQILPKDNAVTSTAAAASTTTGFVLFSSQSESSAISSSPTPASSGTSAPASDSNAHTGLSTGAQAGIGVGCAIAGILGILGILIFLKHWRANVLKRKGTGEAFEKPELEGKGAQKHVEEIAGEEILEMNGAQDGPHQRELDGRNDMPPRAELEAM